MVKFFAVLAAKWGISTTVHLLPCTTSCYPQLFAFCSPRRRGRRSTSARTRPAKPCSRKPPAQAPLAPLKSNLSRRCPGPLPQLLRRKLSPHLHRHPQHLRVRHAPASPYPEAFPAALINAINRSSAGLARPAGQTRLVSQPGTPRRLLPLPSARLRYTTPGL